MKQHEFLERELAVWWTDVSNSGFSLFIIASGERAKRLKWTTLGFPLGNFWIRAATTDMSNLTAIPAPNLPLFQHALDDSPNFCFIAGSFFNTFLHPTDLSLTSATLFSSFEFQSSR
ncbi:hypothetical protein NQ318_021004 [Aromia moschata]|uniref:Uncharacterized protein n=1 Tax=Aromia moschata TaxID=1265417 RepID=A0AAV8YN41_9CUCU|nr:hypothetical protein NQ318_021004 [Aromia moschata]